MEWQVFKNNERDNQGFLYPAKPSFEYQDHRKKVFNTEFRNICTHESF